VKLIAGLGNPGLGYRRTRHNAGFMVVDRLAKKHEIRISRRRFHSKVGEGRIAGIGVLLVKPQTFMNKSGEALAGFVNFHRISLGNLVVIHDDMDLEFGRIKVKSGGGSAGHKGVASIIEHLGSDGFARVRFGIGRPDETEDPSDYVLEPFSGEEAKASEAYVLRAAEAVEAILTTEIEAAMSVFNRTELKLDRDLRERDRNA